MWSGPTSKTCDNTKWVKTISEIMPFSQTLSHISITAQGTKTLIKMNLFPPPLNSFVPVPPSVSLPLEQKWYYLIIKQMVMSLQTLVYQLWSTSDTHMYTHKDGPSVPLHWGGHRQEVFIGRSDTIRNITDRKCGGVLYCSKATGAKIVCAIRAFSVVNPCVVKAASKYFSF